MVWVRPKYPLNPRIKQRQSTDRIGAYLALSLLTGRQYLPADLVAVLANFRRSDVIRWITAVSSWISNDGGMDIFKQMQMAEVLLPDELQRRAAERINQEESNFCLFHPRQLSFALQFALLACKEDAPECEDEKLRFAIGECLLMSSDVLGRIENDHTPEIGNTPDEVNRWVALVYASLSGVRDDYAIVPRATSFWLDIPTRNRSSINSRAWASRHRRKSFRRITASPSKI